MRNRSRGRKNSNVEIRTFLVSNGAANEEDKRFPWCNTVPGFEADSFFEAHRLVHDSAVGLRTF